MNRARGWSILAMWLIVLAACVGLSATFAADAGTGTVGRWVPSDGPNEPIGDAKGIFPGRVVWIHDAEVAKWDGDTDRGGWFEDKHTDATRADRMLSRALRALAATKTDAEAWSKLFRHFNLMHGRGAVGYKPGEKVVVKLNLNCAARQSKPTVGLYNTPQLTIALLRQLVEQAEVEPRDITVYDASRWIPDTIFEPAQEQVLGVRFEDRDGGEGRYQAQPDEAVALHGNDAEIGTRVEMQLPACVTDATYMINAALMKGHDLAGVTLCAKNHFGSVYWHGSGENDTQRGWNPIKLHEAITVHSRPMGSSNPLVDFMGHKHLGGKTVLHLIDALYAAPRQSVGPQKWRSAPFAGGWTGSVFVSQDPVAIESVAVDFFAAEPTAIRMSGAVDNYLHEAALANRPPSGVRYDPEADGTPLESLGVHEHWNSPEKKQYSRNLGTGNGIELVSRTLRPVEAGTPSNTETIE